MTQTRYFNWKDEDKTIALNNWLRGVTQSGLYCGFNWNPTANMTLTLVHTDGEISYDEDLNPSSSLGVTITPQGVLIKEDASITLPISNGDATHPRIDVIIVSHEYQEGIVGGSAATYAVIQGTPAEIPERPALTDITKQVAIGYLYVPAGTTQLQVDDGVQWVRNISPVAKGNVSGVLKEADYDSTAETLTLDKTGRNNFIITSDEDIAREFHSILGCEQEGQKITIKVDGFNGKILSGGNIVSITYDIEFVAFSTIELLSFIDSDGKLKFQVVGINQGSPMFHNIHNVMTGTISEEFLVLTRSSNYDDTAKQIFTGGLGNHFDITLNNGDFIYDVRLSSSIAYPDGTIITLKVQSDTGGAECHLDVTDATSKMNDIGFNFRSGNLYDITNSPSYFRLEKRNGFWDVIPITEIKTILESHEDQLNAIGGFGAKVDIGGGYKTSIVKEIVPADPDLVQYTSGVNKVFCYVDQLGYLHMLGDLLHNNTGGAFSALDTLFTFPSGYRPYNHSTYGVLPLYFKVPVMDDALSLVADEKCILQISSGGEVKLYDSGLDVNRMIDLRAITFKVAT